MAKKPDPRLIDFVRLGNPWLVGENVNRIVPIYVLHNLAAPNIEASGRVQAVKDLAFNTQLGLDNGLIDRISVDSTGYDRLSASTFGLVSPERRIFRSKKTGGADKGGACFPVMGGLVKSTGSDDGLGRRVRELLEGYEADWQARLLALLMPEKAEDPATAFVRLLLGDDQGTVRQSPDERRKKGLNAFEKDCCRFIDNLIVPVADGRRIHRIRNLATGAYLVSILNVIGSLTVGTRKKPPMVFVYGGLPPGNPDDPLIRGACQSFERWVAGGWNSVSAAIAERMEKVKTLPKSSLAERREQQLRQLLSDQLLPSRQKEVDAIIDALRPAFKNSTEGQGWVRKVLESRAHFTKPELTRRVRSLGANIGLAGPDRGAGNPRLFFDTPLLAVLAQGVIKPGETMDFRRFVSKLSEQFGLVVGLGDDETVADRIELSGSGGLDPVEILTRNQELLRQRMVRVGLARTYSDSHTEVLADV